MKRTLLTLLAATTFVIGLVVGPSIKEAVNSKKNLAEGILKIGEGTYNMLKKGNIIGEKKFQNSASSKRLINKLYETPLTDQFGNKIFEEVKINAELDEKNNTLYLGNYTQNWNNQRWKKEAVAQKRFTKLNERTKTFILHPKKVKITNIDEQAYLVPQHGWDTNLKPYEEHKEAQQMIEGGEKIVDWAVSTIPIPYFKKLFTDFIKNATEKEKTYYEELFTKIKQGYAATIIPSYIPNKIIGSTKTAMEYKITFDTQNLNKDVPIFLWEKIVLGEPGYAPSGSFPNRYGELEDVLIKFELKKNKIDSPKQEKEISKKTIENFEVYQKVTEGNINIFIKKGGKEIPLIQHPAQDRVPSLSPDKKKVAFTSNRNNEAAIYVINIDKTGLKKLINIPRTHLLHTPKWLSNTNIYYQEWNKEQITFEHGEMVVARPGFYTKYEINVVTGDRISDHSELNAIIKEESERRMR